MSRNSKMKNKAIRAKEATNQRQNGGGGPARTTPSHGKVRTWYAGLDGKISVKVNAEINRAADQIVAGDLDVNVDEDA